MQQQTDNFPPISRPEQSWSHDLRALFQNLYPYGLPLGGNGPRLTLPDSGLTPKLSSGYAVLGDQLIGPIGQVAIGAAPTSSTKNLYYGLKGFGYYADEPEEPTDFRLGVVSTDVDGITFVAQQLVYTSGRFGVWGRVDLTRLAASADVNIFTAITKASPIGTKAYPYFPEIYPNLPTPDNVGFDKFIVDYAYVKTITALSAAGTNEVLLKGGDATLVTHDDNSSETQDAVTIAAIDTLVDADEFVVAINNSVQPASAGEIEFFVSLIGV